MAGIYFFDVCMALDDLAWHFGNYGGKKLHEWFVEVGAQQVADPMNQKIWKYCQDHPVLRLLSSWAAYAGKYPERRVAAEAQP
jgi:hypothetical protein